MIKELKEVLLEIDNKILLQQSMKNNYKFVVEGIKKEGGV